MTHPDQQPPTVPGNHPQQPPAAPYVPPPAAWAAAQAAAPQPSRSRLDWWTRGPGVILVVITAGLAIFGIVAATDDDSQSSPQDQAAGAKAACVEEFIPARLKSPATARFSGVAIASVDTSAVGETYTVTGSVDAENGFGALIRSRFTCIVHPDGGRWELNSATVD
ncbi:hypothetical protein [Actinoplanes sp. NPDC049118]|uniref:hypothetical protein n=1 Tax=Actinoplanes sp. NPDC049118 TaxID=3155769 RepID=UPI0033EF872E